MKLWCCTRCGSTEVYQDAFVSMNDPVDVQVYDQAFCQGPCEGECKAEEREFADDTEFDDNGFPEGNEEPR